MNRRTVLTIGSGAAVAALAGCTSSSPSEASPGPDPEAAQEHLDAAGTALENADEELKSESEKFEESEFQEGGIDFKTTAIDGYLDTARTELDEAEEHANEEQQEIIDVLRGYIEFATEMVAFLDVFAEGYSQAYTGFTYFQSSRYEDAVDQLETAESTLSETDDLLTVTQSRADELNTERLSEMQDVRIQELRSHLDDMNELVPSFRTMTEAMITLSEGVIDFTEGQTHYENEEYSEAEAAFRSASEDFNAARSTFRAEEESAPTEIKSTFVEMTCYSGALRDGTTHLANATEAIQNRNRERAESESQAANEALNRCDFSSN